MWVGRENAMECIEVKIVNKLPGAWELKESSFVRENNKSNLSITKNG